MRDVTLDRTVTSDRAHSDLPLLKYTQLFCEYDLAYKASVVASPGGMQLTISLLLLHSQFWFAVRVNLKEMSAR